MRFWLFLASFLLCSPFALAQVNLGQTVAPVSRGGAYNSDLYRTYRICIAGDIQNLAQYQVFAETGFDGESCRVDSSRNCQEPYCTKSPFCDTSWHNTNLRLLKNMFYSMAGQWQNIDYRGITGTHTGVQTRLSNNLMHEKCDLVLLPGDQQASGDADTNPPTARDVFEMKQVRAGLKILDDAGVEWLTAKGNHDNGVQYASEISALIEAKSTFRAKSASGLAHSLLIPTRMGKSLCVISAAGIASEDSTESAFVAAQEGCGAGHPTILMTHQIVQEVACTYFADITGYTLTNAGHEEVFMIVGGHETSPVNIPLCASRTNPAAWTGTPALYMINVNAQELTREYDSSNAFPYGATPADSCGGVYAEVELDPGADRINIRNWNPYYQSFGNQRVVEESSCGYTVDSLSEAFDFDARYP